MEENGNARPFLEKFMLPPDDYDFDTVDGNHLYSGFLDVYDEFKDQLLMKMERGKLDKVLWTEKRALMMRRSDND